MSEFVPNIKTSRSSSYTDVSLCVSRVDQSVRVRDDLLDTGMQSCRKVKAVFHSLFVNESYGLADTLLFTCACSRKAVISMDSSASSTS